MVGDDCRDSIDKKHIEISPNDHSSLKFRGGGARPFPEVSIPAPTKHRTDDTKLYNIYYIHTYIYINTWQQPLNLKKVIELSPCTLACTNFFCFQGQELRPL